jgi:hypothetical protein
MRKLSGVDGSGTTGAIVWTYDDSIDGALSAPGT